MSDSLHIALLTISDTRTSATDDSGDTLALLLQQDGHQLADRDLVKDDVYQVRAVVSRWIADPAIHCIITTGGTGFSLRDSTPEAITPLLDTRIEGFGEQFRAISAQQIGSSTIQSRAFAGIANTTLLFCLPGSPNACTTGWTHILTHQLNVHHQPCNFVELIKPQR